MAPQDQTNPQAEETALRFVLLLGAAALVFMGFEALVVLLVFLVIDFARPLRPLWLLVAGIVLTVAVAALHGFVAYVEALTQLGAAAKTGMLHHTWAPLLHTAGLVWMPMAPAAVAVGTLLAGAVLWAVRRRPAWMGLPLRGTAQPQQGTFRLTGSLRRRLHRLVDPADRTLLGYPATGRQPVEVTDGELNVHTFIAGATGSGKTNSILVLLARPIRDGRPVIYVDGKGDPAIVERIRRMAEAAGREFRSFGAGQVAHYNPLRHGDATELKDKLVSVETWTEPFYKRAAERYLQTALRVLRRAGEPIDLDRVFDVLRPERLVEAVHHFRQPDADAVAAYVSSLDDAHLRALTGLQDRLAVLMESDWGLRLTESQDAPMLDLLEAVQQRQVVALSLPGLSHSSFAPALGALIVEDLKCVAAALGNAGGLARWGHTHVVLDEFNVFAGQPAVNLLNKSRYAGYCCIVATQELADLAVDGQRQLLDQIIGSTNVRIIHRMDVPTSAEYLASMIGTEPSFQKTVQIEEVLAGTKPTRMGSYRSTEAFVVHPNVIKRLPPGQAVVVSKVPHLRYAVVQIREVI